MGLAMTPDEAIGGLLISIAAGVVLGVAALLIIYKMVDGDLPFGPGIIAVCMDFVAVALAIHPPHPVVPGVILVCALALMAFFPFAEQKLEEFELRSIDADRLARTFEAIRVRPDNYAAIFELAKQLHGLGFPSHATQLAGAALATLSNEKDEVKNRSLRDLFHNEERLLRKWEQGPQNMQAVKCPGCGAYNRPTDLFCTSCKRPYLLDIVQAQEIKPRIWAKLVVAFAAIALLIPGAAAIAMNLKGALQAGTFTLGFAIVGALIYWLFQPPKHAKEIYQ